MRTDASMQMERLQDGWARGSVLIWFLALICLVVGVTALYVFQIRGDVHAKSNVVRYPKNIVIIPFPEQVQKEIAIADVSNILLREFVAAWIGVQNQFSIRLQNVNARTRTCVMIDGMKWVSLLGGVQGDMRTEFKRRSFTIIPESDTNNGNGLVSFKFKSGNSSRPNPSSLIQSVLFNSGIERFFTLSNHPLHRGSDTLICGNDSVSLCSAVMHLPPLHIGQQNNAESQENDGLVGPTRSLAEWIVPPFPNRSKVCLSAGVVLVFGGVFVVYFMGLGLIDRYFIAGSIGGFVACSWSPAVSG